MESWKEMLSEELAERGESWSDVEAHTFEDDQLERKFDSGFGGTEGVGFTVWTAKSVYFPVCYDGAEWVGVVSRNPDGEATQHQGGG